VVSFAVVPACGQSTRMGRPKLALPLGGRSVIESVISTLQDGGVDHVVVVVAPHVLELAPLALAAGAELVVLSESTTDMRATVEKGLAWIAANHKPQPEASWLLAPGDHPAFAISVVSDLLAAKTNTRHSIIVPTYNGRRGHPTLLRWQHAAGICALGPDQGINSYLRAHADAVLELPVADPGILLNLDTPEDYARLS